MDDLISRRAAINLLAWFTQRDHLGNTPEQIIRWLPSEQPEPCDFCKYQNDCGDMALYCPAERKEGEADEVD